MTPNDLVKQSNCQVTEQTNYGVAKGNADSVDSAVDAFNGLIDKARMHNQYAQNELDRVDEDRDRKANEVMIYQALLLILVIAVAL